MSDLKKYLEDFMESEPSGQDMAELAKKFFAGFPGGAPKTQEELNQRLNTIDDAVADTVEQMLPPELKNERED